MACPRYAQSKAKCLSNMLAPHTGATTSRDGPLLTLLRMLILDP